MKKHNFSGGVYYSFKNLDSFPGLLNFVSTRKFDLDSFCLLKGILKSKFILARQIHGTDTALISKKQTNSFFPKADSLITNSAGVCLGIRTADCVPLIIYDSSKNVLALVHAGWKGTLENIAAKTVKRIITGYKCKVKDIFVGIGPSIDAKDYLVKADVANRFVKNGYGLFLGRLPQAQWRLNLKGVNVHQLISVGINEDRIETSAISTFKSKNFYSRRRGDALEFITGGMIRG